MAMTMNVAYANGEGNGNGCRNRCGDTTNNIDRSTTNNRGGQGGTGIGVGVGIGKASSRSSSSSYSGSSSNSYSSSYQSQGQGQLQGQVGILKNVGPQVVIEDNSVTTYEAAASSAISRAPDAPAPSAECWVSESFGIGGSIVAGGASLGGSTATYDGSCAGFLIAKQVQGDAAMLATLMGYCLGFEQAGVENKLCADWRTIVGGVDAPLPRVETSVGSLTRD
jgi:hypothetical protein